MASEESGLPFFAFLRKKKETDYAFSKGSSAKWIICTTVR